MDAQTIITIVTVLGSAGAWQFYQSRLKLKHQERKEDKGEQTLFRDDLRERVAILEQKCRRNSQKFSRPWLSTRSAWSSLRKRTTG